MFVVDARSRLTSSGLRTTGRRRGSRTDTTASARSRRFSVTLKKNRSAVTLTLTVGTVVPIDANHNSGGNDVHGRHRIALGYRDRFRAAFRHLIDLKRVPDVPGCIPTCAYG